MFQKQAYGTTLTPTNMFQKQANGTTLTPNSTFQKQAYGTTHYQPVCSKNKPMSFPDTNWYVPNTRQWHYPCTNQLKLLAVTQCKTYNVKCNV
jgi:hypothetical protein